MEEQSSLLCETQNIVAESVSDPIGLKQLFSESKEGELRWERNVAGIKIKRKYSINSIITACILAASMLFLIFVPSISTLAFCIPIGILSAFSFGKSNLHCSVWIIALFGGMCVTVERLTHILTKIPETIWWLSSSGDLVSRYDSIPFFQLYVEVFLILMLVLLVIRKLRKKFPDEFSMTKSYVLQHFKTKWKARIAAFAIGILLVVTVYFYGIGFML